MSGDQSSSMGAVIFFGLTGAALLGAMAPGDLEYLNPEDTHRRSGYKVGPPPTSWIDSFSWPVVTQNTDSAQDNRVPVPLPVDAREDLFEPVNQQLQAEAGTELLHGFTAPLIDAAFARLTPPVSQIVNSPPAGPLMPPEQLVPLPPNLAGRDAAAPLHAARVIATEVTAPTSEENTSHTAALARVERATRQLLPRTERTDQQMNLQDRHYVARVTGDQVNLRVAPEITSDTITLVPQNALGIVSQQRGEWVRIEVTGETGWMFGAFVLEQ